MLWTGRQAFAQLGLGLVGVLMVLSGARAHAAGGDGMQAAAWGVNAQRYGLTKPYLFVDSIDDLPAKSQTDALKAVQIAGSAPANMLWPGETASLTIQVVNKTDKPLRAKGKVDIVQYALTTSSDDMFNVAIRKLADAGSVPVEVDIPAKGYQDLTIAPPIPERFGGYALILDLSGQERLFVSSIARTLKNEPLGASYRLCMDLSNIPALQRLGAAPNRIGFAFRSPGDRDYEEYYQRWAKRLREFKGAGLPICVEFGHDTPMNGPIQPLGRPRSYIEMRDGKPYNRGTYIGDIAWLPRYDKDFKAFVKRVAMEFGWPKGPVNAMKLWNEPWEGMSIACWGADMLRFREISVALCEAVEEARKEAGVQILLGGCDSSSNTFDKLFPDGNDDFLSRLDFLSIHYQGLSPCSTVKAWVNRKPSRVLIWDTESWCANSDDRIAGTFSSMYAAGQDRVVGIHSQHVVAPQREVEVHTAQGTQRRTITQAWPPAAAVGALQHFIGNREFDRIVFRGLPWVYLFKGMPGADGVPNPEDATVVVVGDLSPVFGAGSVMFRNVRCLEEVKAKRALHEKLATLPPLSPQRAEVEKQWAVRGPFANVTMKLSDGGGRIGLYDYYGNPIPSRDGKIVIPIDDHGYYLRTDGRSESAKVLLKALQESGVEGMQPVDIVCHDLTAPISAKPVLRIEVANILNRPIAGALKVRLGSLELAYARDLSLGPNERKSIDVAVTGGAADPGNAYPLSAAFDAGPDGLALHSEILHINVIARRSITVDGKLADWKDVLPQTISSDGTISRTDTEAAWLPFKAFGATARKGLATAYLAYDERFFYFAAKIADDTPDGGTLRFETRNDDEFFYPEKVWQNQEIGNKNSPLVEATWPAGVRRYSYAKDPVLPAGCCPDFDNVQIAFNVMPEAEKPWGVCPPGTFAGFTGYYDTDYEYALNSVAEKYGGGSEIWRLRHPKMPYKHFYPRQPKSPMDGAVKDGKLLVVREGNNRIIECAIPWTEIPHAKARLDAGQTIKFSFRVNDSAGVGCLELAKDRSVSKRNFAAFRVDWKEHWANEVEFGFEK